MPSISKRVMSPCQIVTYPVNAHTLSTRNTTRMLTAGNGNGGKRRGQEEEGARNEKKEIEDVPSGLICDSEHRQAQGLSHIHRPSFWAQASASSSVSWPSLPKASCVIQ